MNPVEFPVTVGSQLAQEDDRVAQVLTAVALLAGVEHAVVGEQIRDTTANVFPYHSGRQASASMPSASPGSDQGRSRAFQLRPASSDLKRPRLFAA